jgi:CheY-like chemotaxis protein
MSSQPSFSAATADPRGRPPLRRVVLEATLDPHWADLVRALEFEGMEFDIVAPRTPPADVVACATRADGVVVVDLADDASIGLAAVSSCHRAAPLVPVIVVASNPSLELTRSVRLSGAFYLALHPVALEEMRSILQTAFQCLQQQRASAITCRATRRILIIDDDADFRASTAALLEARGYSVTTAPSGRQGLDMLLSERPDLVVLDVMMEYDGAGYEVNQAVKYGTSFEDVRHIPILMVSSIPDDPATRFSRAGEVDMVTPDKYLTKPLDIPRFLSEVSELLGEPRAELMAGVR